MTRLPAWDVGGYHFDGAFLTESNLDTRVPSLSGALQYLLGSFVNSGDRSRTLAGMPPIYNYNFKYSLSFRQGAADPWTVGDVIDVLTIIKAQFERSQRRWGLFIVVRAANGGMMDLTMDEVPVIEEHRHFCADCAPNPDFDDESDLFIYSDDVVAAADIMPILDDFTAWRRSFPRNQVVPRGTEKKFEHGDAIMVVHIPPLDYGTDCTYKQLQTGFSVVLSSLVEHFGGQDTRVFTSATFTAQGVRRASIRLTKTTFQVYPTDAPTFGNNLEEVATS